MTSVRRRRRPQTESKSRGKSESEPDTICCETCLWLDQGSGECHSGRPTPIPLDDGEIATEWPPVEDGAWCGTWVHYAERKSVLAYLAEHDGEVEFGAEADVAEDDGEEEDDGD